MKRLKLILVVMLLFPALTYAGLRSWILTKHDALGFYNVSTETLDSLAAQYDWLDGYDGAQAVGDQGQLDYLRTINPNIIVCLYNDNSFSSFDFGLDSYPRARSMGIDPEDIYLHFRENGTQSIRGGAPTEDKFGLTDVYGDGAWRWGPSGQGVFVFDSSTQYYTEVTNAAYNGTNQQFCSGNNDCLYLGFYGRFKEANFALATPASADWSGVWEYYDGSGWSALQIVSDGTNDMTQDGKVEWQVPTLAQWQRVYIDDEVYIDYWVRLRCNNAGTTPPSFYTIKAQEYISSAGGSNYNIPGWDPANDTDNDGVWDTNNNPNATATFRWQSRVKGNWLFKARNGFFQKNNPDFLMLFKTFIFNYVRDNNGSGYMGDDWPWDGLPTSEWNKIDGFENFPSEASADSAYMDWSVYYQAQAIRDTLVAANGADTLVGGNISELTSAPYYYATGSSNSPMHYFSIEMYNRIINGGPYAGEVESEFLRYPIIGASKDQSMLLLHYYGTSKWGNEKERWDNFALACHYLIAGPKIYFGINRVTTDARAMGWIRAIDFNVGQPVIPNNYEDTTQHSWYVWDANDHIYARDFANALVLVRFKPSWNSSVDSSTINTYNLGGYYKRLWPNGSLGDSTNQVSLLNSDGAILIPTDVVIDTTVPCEINDLNIQNGINPGEVDLTWTARGEDGCGDLTGRNHHYEIRYSTALITEQNWDAASLLSNPPSPADPGTTQNYSITGLNTGQRYYVAIKAFDEMGNASPISNCPEIITDGIPVPVQIGTEIIDPNTGTAEVSCWSVDSSVPVFYEFALDSTVQFPAPIIEIDLLADSIASATYSGLSENINYYWRCRTMASDHSDSSAWSQPINFIITASATFSLTENDCVYPPNGSVIDTDQPVFIVNYVSNVSNIYIQVDDNIQFSSPIESGFLSVVPGENTSWTITEPIAQRTTYYWRVSSDNMVWTSPISFSVALSINAYPNPFRVSDGHQNITFTNIPENSKISIATVSGKVVKSESDIPAGDWIWDVKNDSGKDLVSGVYLYYVDFKGGPTSGKIMIIR